MYYYYRVVYMTRAIEDTHLIHTLRASWHCKRGREHCGLRSLQGSESRYRSSPYVHTVSEDPDALLREPRGYELLLRSKIEIFTYNLGPVPDVTVGRSEGGVISGYHNTSVGTGDGGEG